MFLWTTAQSELLLLHVDGCGTSKQKVSDKQQCSNNVNNIQMAKLFKCDNAVQYYRIITFLVKAFSGS